MLPLLGQTTSIYIIQPKNSSSSYIASWELGQVVFYKNNYHSCPIHLIMSSDELALVARSAAKGNYYLGGVEAKLVN